MAIIGVQHEGKVEPQGPEYQKLTAFVEKGTDSSKPKYWEAASVTDNRGFQNEVVIPYWQTKADFDQWKADSGFGEFWSGLQEQPEHGWFLEVFLPTIDRFETVFSDNTVPKGAANMRAGVSGEMQQHVYWGRQIVLLASGPSQSHQLSGPMRLAQELNAYEFLADIILP
ncbi:putative hem-containing dehydratase [Septoria linicola]|nr:putative hem-containing dehydratase [Septoria linicola]